MNGILTLGVLPLGLREERDLHLQIVLEGERCQGLVEGSGRCEDDSIRHHVGIDDAGVEEVRAWRRLETLINRDEIGMESVCVEHFLLGRANHLVAKLLDLVAANVQTLPVGQQLEGREAVDVVQRGLGKFCQRVKHLIDDVQVLLLAQFVLHDQIGVSPHNHRIVDVNGIVATLPLTGDVQRWISTHIRGNLSGQVLQSGWGSG